jgi:hypothetical protein
VILALEVLREMWRDRWLAAGAAASLAVAPITVGAHGLSLGAGAKAATDVGLFAVWALASGFALGIGLTVLRPRPDLVWALTRPVSRARFATDRFLGACGALGILTALLHAGWAVGALLAGMAVPASLVAAFVLSWAGACVVAGVAGLFAQVLPPAPAGLCAVAMVVVGHLADEYAALAAEGDVPPTLARALFLLLPDLDRFDAGAILAHGVTPDPAQVGLAVGYGAAWCAVLVLLATIALSRRDLP